MNAEARKAQRARQVYRLCAAVEYLVATRGYRFGVADVVKTAGMSRRSFYEHFVSLESLMGAMHVAFAHAGVRSAEHELVDDTLATYPSCESIFFALGHQHTPWLTGEQNQAHCVKRAAEGRRATPALAEFAEGMPLRLWTDDVLTGGER